MAANLALMSFGSDTGSSIRTPSGFQALVGLRPSTGLVSRCVHVLIAVSCEGCCGGAAARGHAKLAWQRPGMMAALQLGLNFAAGDAAARRPYMVGLMSFAASYVCICLSRKSPRSLRQGHEAPVEGSSL